MVSPLAPILKMYARMGAIPVRRCPMNVTVRASLIALIAIVGACWAIPVLLVRVVPSDAGMIAMMTLIYLVLPVTAIALACSPRTPRGRSSGYPRRSESDPRSCFPSRSRAAGTLRSMGLPIPQSATPPWACALGRLLDSIAKPSPRKPPQARSPRGYGTHRSNNHAGKPRAKQFLQRPASHAAYDVQQIR